MTLHHSMFSFDFQHTKQNGNSISYNRLLFAQTKKRNFKDCFSFEKTNPILKSKITVREVGQLCLDGSEI